MKNPTQLSLASINKLRRFVVELEGLDLDPIVESPAVRAKFLYLYTSVFAPTFLPSCSKSRSRKRRDDCRECLREKCSIEFVISERNSPWKLEKLRSYARVFAACIFPRRTCQLFEIFDVPGIVSRLRVQNTSLRRWRRSFGVSKGFRGVVRSTFPLKLCFLSSGQIWQFTCDSKVECRE